MAKTYGYLARDVRLNNPSYLIWKDRPIGENVFSKHTRVELLRPTKHEKSSLRNMATRDNQSYFVVKVDGHRVYLSRTALLTEDEYNEARCTEDKTLNVEKKRRRSKLALLKNSARGLGQDKA